MNNLEDWAQDWKQQRRTNFPQWGEGERERGRQKKTIRCGKGTNPSEDNVREVKIFLLKDLQSNFKAPLSTGNTHANSVVLPLSFSSCLGENPSVLSYPLKKPQHFAMLTIFQKVEAALMTPATNTGLVMPSSFQALPIFQHSSVVYTPFLRLQGFFERGTAFSVFLSKRDSLPLVGLMERQINKIWLNKCRE